MATNNSEYDYINCDDYESLDYACQSKLELSVQLKDGETFTGKANELRFKSKVEYLVIDIDNAIQELRLDQIASFSHKDIGTVTIKNN